MVLFSCLLELIQIAVNHIISFKQNKDKPSIFRTAFEKKKTHINFFENESMILAIFHKSQH